MALNPSLRLMVDNAQARYRAEADPVARKRAEIKAKHKIAEAELREIEKVAEQISRDRQLRKLDVAEQLMVLGLCKATKRELQQVILNAMVEEVAL